MAKPKVILPADVIENWGLGYDLGCAVVLLREAADTSKTGKESAQALKGAAAHILNRVDAVSNEYLRATWRKNKKKVRAAADRKPSQGKAKGTSQAGSTTSQSQP